MKAYADPSFLVALYWFEEEFAREAAQCMLRHDEPLAFTPFHRHEVRAALRRKVFLGEITDDEKKAAFRELHSDLEDGILLHTPIPWTEAFRQADTLGEAEGQKIGARSSDLLHVGIALALEAEHFWTFDTVQRALAKGAGLKIRF